PREHPDVRDPLPRGNVRGPPRDRSPPPSAPDVRIAVPAGKPVAPRLSQRHDPFRETGQGDARRDRAGDWRHRGGGPRERRGGLPLSPPSVEGEALRDYYARKFGFAKGHDYAVVYPAVNRLLQAAGRAIRSERDRAAIVLLEGRILEPRYARCLPPDFAPARSE